MLKNVSPSAKACSCLRFLEKEVSRDTLAQYFFDEEGQRLATKWIQVCPDVKREVTIRGRYIEDLIIQYAKERNVKQVISVPAGLNTFPYRHPRAHLLENYVEVDLPQMLEFKQSRLKEIQAQGVLLSQKPKVQYIAVDLSLDTVEEELKKINLDWEKPSVYVFEGMSYYLTYEKLKSLINVFYRTMVEGSVLIMDYFPDYVQQNEGLQKLLGDLPSDGAELCVTYLNDGTLKEVLGSFKLVSDDLECDLEKRYYSDPITKPIGSVVVAEK